MRRFSFVEFKPNFLHNRIIRRCLGWTKFYAGPLYSIWARPETLFYKVSRVNAIFMGVVHGVFP